MAQMTLYVDHVEIEQTKAKVISYMNDNNSTQRKIFTVLTNLEQSIRMNRGQVSNSKEEVIKSMTTFTGNNNKCINVFAHVVEMYFNAIDSSVSHIENARSQV